MQPPNSRKRQLIPTAGYQYILKIGIRKVFDLDMGRKIDINILHLKLSEIRDSITKHIESKVIEYEESFKKELIKLHLEIDSWTLPNKNNIDGYCTIHDKGVYNGCRYKPY